ncbi:MAG: DnaJ domain-containing protein [Deltaproteobacteria bacterium]|jgi:curved DNA-binding protein CbpA|nr:DnaJ domain-containing protein [Deltaproteobacteria bacterium]
MRYQKEFDFYELLGLDPGADFQQLRSSYLKLALENHPDRHPGDQKREELFKRISQAYAVLRDPSSRTRYDKLRLSRLSKIKPKTPPKPPFPQKERAPKATQTQPKSESFKSSQTFKPEQSAQTFKPYQSTHTFSPNQSAQTFKPFQSAQSFQSVKTNLNRNSAQTYKKESGSADDIFFGPKKSSSSPQGSSSRPLGTDNRADLDEFMADFLKTPAGRQSLEKMRRELNKAGAGLAINRWLYRARSLTSPSALAGKVKNTASRFFSGLKSKLKLNPFSKQHSTSPEDIVFGLSLSKQAAMNGTIITISYLRDNNPHSLQVKIPSALKPNSRLRLPNQGNLNERTGRRGALLLELNVQDSE